MACTPLTDLADDELAGQFQAGDRLALEALIARYRRFARAKSRGYFLVGGDADDIEQEALIFMKPDTWVQGRSGRLVVEPDPRHPWRARLQYFTTRSRS